jgi:polyhydroxyalkanoate synthesis repressor PhaR
MSLIVMSEEEKTETPPITIKKYANRRLYNTQTSSYVTLDYLAQMVKEGTDFVVYDAKSGEDITRQILTHIIVEEEGKGQNLLPISFLRHLISFYGDSLESVVPNYLENSMQAFVQNQEQMRDYMQNTLGDLNPMNQFEEMGKKNVAMFEETMKMFMPFFPGTDGGGENMTKGKGAASSPSPAPEADGEDGAQLDELRDQLEQMQQQIDKLTSGGKK